MSIDDDCWSNDRGSVTCSGGLTTTNWRRNRVEDRWLVFRSAAWALTVHRISQNVRLFEVKFSPSCSPSHAPTDFPSLCRRCDRLCFDIHRIPCLWKLKWKFGKTVYSTHIYILIINNDLILEFFKEKLTLALIKDKNFELFIYKVLEGTFSKEIYYFCD